MATGNVITTAGLKLSLNRIFKSTPDFLAPTKFKVGTNTTTPTVGDTDLGTGVNINGGNTKSFVTGYPVLDETNMQSTIRCLINTTEANGNSLTEFGIFNEDSSALMFSRSVFTSISKTDSVEVSFVQKDVIS